MQLFKLVAAALVAGIGSAQAGTLAQLKARKIYQIVTDRFNNPSSTAGCSNLSDYCGGTWQGIIAKLDYIQGMGFDTIWISPVRNASSVLRCNRGACC